MLTYSFLLMLERSCGTGGMVELGPGAVTTLLLSPLSLSPAISCGAGEEESGGGGGGRSSYEQFSSIPPPPVPPPVPPPCCCCCWRSLSCCNRRKFYKRC